MFIYRMSWTTFKASAGITAADKHGNVTGIDPVPYDSALFQKHHDNVAEYTRKNNGIPGPVSIMIS